MSSRVTPNIAAARGPTSTVCELWHYHSLFLSLKLWDIFPSFPALSITQPCLEKASGS